MVFVHWRTKKDAELQFDFEFILTDLQEIH